tara:strand:- start:1302 stop:1661 length:360 start_codon:yes stop_codon:yes gene_type:complete
MRKLMVVAVMSLGSLTAFAQEEIAIEVAAEGTEVAAEATEVMAETSVSTEVVAVQDGFAEVALENVPTAITEALAAAHPGATISKAYMNEADQYKLEVTQEDGAAVELYADAEGNWIEM